MFAIVVFQGLLSKEVGGNFFCAWQLKVVVCQDWQSFANLCFTELRDPSCDIQRFEAACGCMQGRGVL